MNKLLIDTNILVYAIDKDSKYYSRATINIKDFINIAEITLIDF